MAILDAELTGDGHNLSDIVGGGSHLCGHLFDIIRQHSDPASVASTVLRTLVNADSYEMLALIAAAPSARMGVSWSW